MTTCGTLAPGNTAVLRQPNRTARPIDGRHGWRKKSFDGLGPIATWATARIGNSNALFLRTGPPGKALDPHGCGSWLRLRPVECRPQLRSASFVAVASGFSRVTRPPCLGPAKPGRSRSPQPRASGRLNGVGWRWSGRLKLRPTGRRAWRRPGLQAQVREDLLDHRRFQDGGDDLQLAAAVRAVLQVDLESEASAKTYLYSSYVAAKTRLSSLAQLSRTGR